MSLFVLVIVIGALNLALGYALAVRLGFGPEGLRPTWETLSAAGMDCLIDDPWRQQAMPEPAPFAEAPVLAFRSDLVKNEESLIRIDTELRAPRALAGPAVEAHVRGVQTSCETYLADLKRRRSSFDYKRSRMHSNRWARTSTWHWSNNRPRWMQLPAVLDNWILPAIRR